MRLEGRGKKMSKGKKMLKIINPSKPFLAVFSVILSLLVVVGSTYSWITYSDEQINQSKATRKKLSAVIDELFSPNLKWAPGIKTEKNVSVRNNGQVPAFVRISLYEFLAQFELDMNDRAGNGSLKIVSKSSGTDMKIDDSATWEKGSTYKLASGKYYTVAEVYKSDKKNPDTAYMYKKNRIIEEYNYVTINFNDGDISDVDNPPNTGVKNYWYYSDGYFYYSEVLQPKDKTTQLIQSVSLDKKLPNKFKGSIYQLVPVMDAHDNTKALLEDWKIISGSYIENMYHEKIH